LYKALSEESCLHAFFTHAEEYTMEYVISVLLSGISVGGQYALIAIG
jgi:hypothetical protein